MQEALQEDIGDGDHTTLSSIPFDTLGKAQLLIKQDGIIAGVEIAQKIFHLNLPYYCIVNLLLDRMIYPEIIHYQLDPLLIASSLKANIDKCFPFEEFKNKIYNKDHDQIFLSEIN